jgi:hypothetical protein
MLKKKSWSEIDNRVSKIVHRFAVSQKVKILGSNSFKGMLYPSDLDVVSQITDSAKVLAHHFQKVFSGPLPFLFIDFKAGHGPAADGKLRWTARQLKAGKNNGILLESALKDQMPVKLDFVVPIDGQFVEVSELYETPWQIKKPIQQIEAEMEADISTYVREGNTMKSLKRFYSLLCLKTGHERVKRELVAFFNSEVGLVNKICNDLVLLQSIKKLIPPEEFRDAVQAMKQRASVVEWVNAAKFETDSVPKLIKYLRRKISPYAKDALNRLR